MSQASWSHSRSIRMNHSHAFGSLQKLEVFFQLHWIPPGLHTQILSDNLGRVVPGTAGNVGAWMAAAPAKIQVLNRRPIAGELGERPTVIVLTIRQAAHELVPFYHRGNMGFDVERSLTKPV